MSKIDWASLGGQQGSGSSKGKTRFIEFKNGSKHTVRLIGEGKQFVKFFVKNQGKSRSIVVNPELAQEAADLLTKALGVECKPQERFSINVFDRSDNQIKILEGGRSIFKYFALWAQSSGQKPSSNAGGNWLINSEGEGQQGRKYTVMALGAAPFTDAERELAKSGGLYKLDEIYKEVPLEEVVKIATGKNDKDDNSGHEELVPASKSGSGKSVNEDELW